MHDINYIRENSEQFDKELKRRGLEAAAKHILALDEIVRGDKANLQELLAQKNTIAKEIGAAKGKGEDASELFSKAEKLKSEIAELESGGAEEQKLHDILSAIPNVLDSEVPQGADEDANKEIRQWGEQIKFEFAAKAHDELGEALGLMDFTQTAKISGARFATLSGSLARLERALANFMLDININEFGYSETSTPLLVKSEAVYGSGQLPKFSEDLFQTTDDKWLIPTAEVPLTNLVREKILGKGELPLRLTAHTPCFRSEAGSAGRDTRGMIRLHQFSKVELVSITDAESSEAEHQRMVGIAEEILKRLKLPYRTMLLCSGDTGFCARKTYDIEVWLPSQNTYREISSCSNCGDFQARRMRARYKEDKATKFVHTLNGSALPTGRTLVAILENYQNADGTINVPEVLVPYMNGVKLIEKK